MRIFTRGDLDGFASAVLLTTTESVKEIMFVHPKDAQDGRFEATSDDILVNLPYVPGCGLWFDHHISEEKKLKDIKGFKGAYAVAPSAARVVFNYYRSPRPDGRGSPELAAKLDAYKEMLHDIDRFDSGQLTTEDVIAPKGWILLGYTLDPRSGLGPEFQKYFRWLVEYVKEVPLDKVLEHREVKKRIDKLRAEQAEFTQILKEHAKQDGNVVLTDLRHLNNVPTGNRFLVYTMFPTANAEVRIFWGKGKQNVVIACGHSIFNRTCKSNMGRMLAEYGGGGHTGAGTCQVPVEKSEEVIKEIIKRLKD